MNGGKLVAVVLVALVLAGWLWLRWQTKQVDGAEKALRRAVQSGHMKSMTVERSRRQIVLRVSRPTDAGWMLQPSGGIAAVASVIPGWTITADPARASLVVTL